MSIMKHIFLLVLLLVFGACKDQFDPVDKVRVIVNEDISDLGIPTNSIVAYENIQLIMNDANNWNESYSYVVHDLKEGVEVLKGSYSNCLIRMEVIYTNNNVRERIMAEGYLGISAQNFIKPVVYFDVKFVRRK